MIEYLIATDSVGKWRQNNDFHKKMQDYYRDACVMSIAEAANLSTTSGLSTFNAGNLRIYNINDIAVISGTGFDVDCLMIGDKDKIQEVKQDLESRTGYKLGFCLW